MNIALGNEFRIESEAWGISRVPGDIEIRAFGWTIYAAWGPYAGWPGFHLEGHGTDRHWYWDEVRDALVKRLAFWRR